MQASQAVQANLNMFHLHLSTVSDGLKTAATKIKEHVTRRTRKQKLKYCVEYIQKKIGVMLTDILKASKLKAY